MDAKIRLTGVKELNAALRQLPQRMQDRVYNAAVAAGARDFRNAVKQATPVGAEDPHPKYGRGRDNIRMTRDRERPKGAPRYIVHIGRAFWLMFYEFGTSRQPQRAFFRPAFDAGAERALRKMTDALARGLAREAKKLAGQYGVARKAILGR
jgi:HK97 gp10 family phage protein